MSPTAWCLGTQAGDPLGRLRQPFQGNLSSSRGGGGGILSSLPGMKETQLRGTRGRTLETLALRAYGLSENLEAKLQAQLLTSAQ